MRFVATTHPIFNDNHNVMIIMYDHTHVHTRMRAHTHTHTHTHCGYPIVQYPNALQIKSKGHCYNPPCKLTKLTPL